MARRSYKLALAGTLAALLALPFSAVAQEVETEDLPPYAAEELEAARSAQSGDPVAQAQAIPPPPSGVSQPEEVPYSERDRGDVDFDDFYTELSDDGSWVETPEYGYVFIPHRQAEVRDWRPYTYGQWIWTRHGWTWVSEEPFGWATYHYGRWTWIGSYGWAWVPGYTWGPAWVAWRYGDSAIGWAPLYPGYVSVTASYPFYDSHWVYIGPTYFYAHPVHHHHYAWHRTHYYHRHTHYASHWHGGHGGRSSGAGYVYSGPPRSFVERRASAPVRETRIEVARRPEASRFAGRSGNAPDRVQLYRPEVAKSRFGADAGNSRREVRVPENRVPRGAGSGLVSPRDAGRASLQPQRRVNAAQPERITQPKATRMPDRGAPAAPRAIERGERPKMQQQPGRIQAPRSAEPRANTAPRKVAPQSAPRQIEKRSAPKSTPRNVEPQRVSPKSAPRNFAPKRAEPSEMRRSLAPAQRPSASPRTVSPQRSYTPQRSNVAPKRAAPSNSAPRSISNSRSSAPRIAAPRSSAPRASPQRMSAPRGMQRDRR